MVFNTTFNNILVISSRPPLSGIRLTTFVVIGTDYIGSYKYNYYSITTTTVPTLTYRIKTSNMDECTFHTNNHFTILLNSIG